MQLQQPPPHPTPAPPPHTTTPFPLLSHPTPLTSLQTRASLLSWYDANHRILPWRRNPHSKLAAEAVAAAAAEGRVAAPADLPLNQFIYWVWVCEVMSQQTQVRAALSQSVWVQQAFGRSRLSGAAGFGGRGRLCRGTRWPPLS